MPVKHQPTEIVHKGQKGEPQDVEQIPMIIQLIG